MEATTSERHDFIPYPTNRVVGTVADAKNAHAAIDTLLQAGFDQQDIDILPGDEDIQRLDPTGEEHGFLAHFQRTLLRVEIVEEKETGERVDSLMGNKPEERFRFIQEKAEFAEDLDI